MGRPWSGEKAPINTMTCTSRTRSEQKIPWLFFAAWSHGAVVYAWNGKEVVKLQVSDYCRWLTA